MSKPPDIDYQRHLTDRPGNYSILFLAIAWAACITQMGSCFTPLLVPILDVSLFPLCIVLLMVLAKYIFVLLSLADARYEGRGTIASYAVTSSASFVLIDGAAVLFLI